MNIFSRIGSWIEHRFPEKMSTGEVKIWIETLSLEIEKLKQQLQELQTTLESFKNQSALKNITAGRPSHPTPFATRLSPVSPNGGNRSPQ